MFPLMHRLIFVGLHLHIIFQPSIFWAVTDVVSRDTGNKPPASRCGRSGLMVLIQFIFLKDVYTQDMIYNNFTIVCAVFC